MTTKTITIRLDRELFDAVAKMAGEQERTNTWVINNLLRRQLAIMGLDDLKTGIRES
jgi:predicted transcriptional regulator